jgi:hypothetical protein
MIGDVNAGSWFATLTSAGMGGEGLKTVQVVVGRTAALLTIDRERGIIGRG